MKNSATARIVLTSILFAFCFSVVFAGDENINATISANTTNAIAEKAMPLNCSDLRNCVENCAQIQNCSMYLICIENCTINATAGFEEATGVVVVKR